MRSFVLLSTKRFEEIASRTTVLEQLKTSDPPPSLIGFARYSLKMTHGYGSEGNERWMGMMVVPS